MNWGNILLSACMQGALWSLLALGVYCTFRLLNFADMTCDGSFTLGAAVVVVLIDRGLAFPLAVLISVLAGALAGLVTAFFNTKMKIPALLSGILTQLALYSINLRIMGRANYPLISDKSIFEFFKGLLPLSFNPYFSDFLLSLLISILVISFLYWFFGTELGSVIRASGHNPAVVRSFGASTKLTTVIALMIGNALIALAGALIAQNQGFADLNMGTGAIVIGLAAIMIGEVVFFKRNFYFVLLSIILGSIVYRIIVAIVLALGLPTQDMKLFSVCVVAVALFIPEFRKSQKERSLRRYNNKYMKVNE